MKRLLFVVLMFAVAVSMSAQSLSLAGFRLLETDLTAITQGTQEIDQNGEVAALIKVVTSETGFSFDIGALGVVGTKQAVGEIWVYIPKRAQKISIFHQQYGVIRNYYFPIPIESGRTYELKLNVEKEQQKIEIVEGVADDYASAYRTYKATAAMGDASAQFYVGYFTYNGMGVAQDYKEAVEWYKKSANQGDARAQCNLGICYENGNGVDKDLSQAFYWYTQSAKQNNATAQYNLGDCYYNGKGTKQNYKQAVVWFTKAAEQNQSDAVKMIGTAYYQQGTQLLLAKKYKGAFNSFVLSAEHGRNAKAQIRLGDCYSYGWGTNKKPRKAEEWYRKAYESFLKDAEEGDASAYIELADCYISGRGVEYNIQEAVKWLKKAREQGPLDAKWEDIIKAYEEGQ